MNKSSTQPNFRTLINLFEGRIPAIEYDDVSAEKVIARLQGYNSQSYTKLAQKIQRMQQLKEEISTLEEEIKEEGRTDVNGLFDAADECKTRVVETLSFIFTLSKNPEETVSPKYKDILTKLSKHLTPELIQIMENLKKVMVTRTQKSPSLKVKPKLDENINNPGKFDKLAKKVAAWGQSYDQRLLRLIQAAGL